MEHTPNAISIGLVPYALVCCVALVFSLWCIRGLYTCIQAITLKHELPRDTAEPGRMLPFQHSSSLLKACTLGNVFLTMT